MQENEPLFNHLRNYQKEAVEAIENNFKENKTSLLVLPTGTGKTVTFAKVIYDYIEKGKVLVIAHREEMLLQAQQKLKDVGINSSLEKAGITATDSNDKVIVASIQTISRDKRLNKYQKDEFALIVVDEAHHASAPSYKKVFDYFENAKILGVTATPTRMDNLDELNKIFPKITYEYKVMQAIKDKYLCDIELKFANIKIDIKEVKMQQGDFSTTDLGISLEPYLKDIAKTISDVCKDRKTVVFLPLVSTAKTFNEYLKENGMNSVELDGTTPSEERHQILKDFNEGKNNVLVNVLALTEGWDCPSADAIVVLRPTKSRGLYQQMVGRGLRTFEGKKNCLILDFLWLTERHDLCKPYSIIANDNENKTQYFNKRLKDGNLMEQVKEIEHAHKESVEKRLKLELEANRNRLKIREQEEKSNIPPYLFIKKLFENFDKSSGTDFYNYVIAKKYKIKNTRSLTSEKAFSQGLKTTMSVKNQDKIIEFDDEDLVLISDIASLRSSFKLASPKQLRVLWNNDVKDANLYTFGEAKKAIDKIFSNQKIEKHIARKEDKLYLKMMKEALSRSVNGIPLILPANYNYDVESYVRGKLKEI